MQTEHRNVEQVIASIQALDLDPIKFKLMDPEEGQGWSREYVDRMETAYKRFLILLVKYPEETIAPSKDVDKFWHGHILDTMKYAADCERVFGYFLHHFPYFGMRGEEDARNLAEAGNAMDRLYRQEFGEATQQQPAYCGVQAAAYCGAEASAYCGAEASAYCGAAGEPKHSGYCGAAAGAKAAYCGAAGAAYCGAAAKSGGSAAYCGAALPAYCGSAIEQHAAAYCGVAAGSNDAAYCGIAKPVADKLKTHMRPALTAA